MLYLVYVGVDKPDYWRCGIVRERITKEQNVPGMIRTRYELVLYTYIGRYASRGERGDVVDDTQQHTIDETHDTLPTRGHTNDHNNSNTYHRTRSISTYVAGMRSENKTSASPHKTYERGNEHRIQIFIVDENQNF